LRPGEWSYGSWGQIGLRRKARLADVVSSMQVQLRTGKKQSETNLRLRKTSFQPAGRSVRYARGKRGKSLSNTHDAVKRLIRPNRFLKRGYTILSPGNAAIGLPGRMRRQISIPVLVKHQAKDPGHKPEKGKTRRLILARVARGPLPSQNDDARFAGSNGRTLFSHKLKIIST